MAGDVIDFCMDMTAEGFRSIAPKEFQRALQPGGFAEIRPGLNDMVVKSLLQESVIRDIPVLKQSEKSKLLASMVDFLLDSMIKDAHDVLLAPEERLDMIRMKQEQIFKIMGRKKLFLYRLRRYPKDCCCQ